MTTDLVEASPKTTRLVGYLRVSTDDKGQDPLRQQDVIQAWADRGGHEVIAWVVDEGTSGGTDPFQRQRVLEAIDLAEKQGATGIVVESVDRWTREGSQRLGMTEFFLKLDHDLTLEIADLPPGMDAFTREIITGLMAACAKEFRRRLREQIKSGLARAKAHGWPRGRPGRKPKEPFSDKEKALVRGMVLEEGLGVDKVALELSKLRGAWDVADRKVQARLKTCPTWVWHQIHKELPDVSLALKARAKGGPSRATRQRPIRPTRVRNGMYQSRYAKDRLAPLANTVDSEQLRKVA